MSGLLEVTIRSKKQGVSDAEFGQARDRFLAALQTVPGVGPVWGYDTCQSQPQHDPPLTLALIRYRSVWSVARVGMTPRVVREMLPYLRLIDLRVAVFVRPDNANGSFPRDDDLRHGFRLTVFPGRLPRGEKSGDLEMGGTRGRGVWVFRTLFGVKASRSTVVLETALPSEDAGWRVEHPLTPQCLTVDVAPSPS